MCLRAAAVEEALFGIARVCYRGVEGTAFAAEEFFCNFRQRSVVLIVPGVARRCGFLGRWNGKERFVVLSVDVFSFLVSM